MKISIFGLGHVGCVNMGCLAKDSHKIIGVDVDSNKVDLINQGKATVFETGLDKIISNQREKGNISATLDYKKAVLESDVSFICVGTPTKKNSNSADLKHVFNVTRELKKIIKKYKIIVTKSTVPVTTGDKIEKILKNLKNKKLIDIVSNPEWMTLEKAKDQVYSWCEDTGYLLYKDQKKLIIFASHSFDDDGELTVGNTTVYPRSVVKKIERLK